MTAYREAFVGYGHRVEVIIVFISLGPLQRPCHIELPALIVFALPKRVEVDCLRRLLHGRFVLLPFGRRHLATAVDVIFIHAEIARYLQTRGIIGTQTIHDQIHGVDRGAQLGIVLSYVLSLHEPVVEAVEVGIEVDEQLLERKGFPPVRDVVVGIGTVGLQVFKRLAII